MLLPRTKMCRQGNEASGADSAVSAPHAVSFVVVGLVQYVPELHQFPNQGCLSIL